MSKGKKKASKRPKTLKTMESKVYSLQERGGDDLARLLNKKNLVEAAKLSKKEKEILFSSISQPVINELNAIKNDEKELKRKKRELAKEIKALEKTIQVLDSLMEDEEKIEKLYQLIKKQLMS